MQNDRSTYLDLPLPSGLNTLNEDLPRLREAFLTLDAKVEAMDGSVTPVAKGGTGQSTVALAREALGLGNTTGALPLANGGTGQTTAALARDALGLGNTTGALPIANGGTGQTTAALARNALGLGNTTGALPVANGGTGTTSVAGIIQALYAPGGAKATPTYVLSFDGSGAASGYTTPAQLVAAANKFQISTAAPTGTAVEGTIWFQIEA